MAAMASAIPLLHALAALPAPWWLMRLVSGYCFAVLYIVIESWLNERSTNESRGLVLSVYQVINLTVLTIGQMDGDACGPPRLCAVRRYVGPRIGSGHTRWR